jgi:hypothetical protein
MDDVWLRCSACKKDIKFLAQHYVCSVSTCNRNRTRLVFCSVACWDSHVAILRHRDAWAEEARAPSREQWRAEQAEAMATPDRPAASPSPAPATARANPAPQPVRPAPAMPSGPQPQRVVATPPPANAATGDFEREILIVVSKMKKYIKDRSGMNCSDAVAEGLSDHVRAVCDDAIRAAGNDGRKTVLDRDVPKVRRPG